jgi:hypothetical protein
MTAAKSVGAGALRAHEEVTTAGQGLEGHEEGGRALARVLVVDPLRMAGGQRQGRAHVGQQLLGGFVQTDERASVVIRPLVDGKHVFHGGHKLRIGVGRNAPGFLQPGFERIFLSVCRTVS